MAYGVPFDRDADGNFLLSREAAHSRRRIVHVSGDRTGAEIMRALIARVRATPSIRVLEGYEADELISVGGRVAGVRLVRPAAFGNGTYEFFPACAVVLATGGVGGLFAVTTNPAYARGESIAMAARAGAVIADAEFVQFHPTAINVGADPAPLATEALRGEGATLINAKGERFMTRIDPRAEMSPRDIVARGVFAEIASGRGAFLDCRKAIGARFPEAFPTVYALCRAAGIDPEREPIPVAPAAHYHMGGIATDGLARTSVAGCGPSARSPRPACTVPTALRRTLCSRRSCSERVPRALFAISTAVRAKLRSLKSSALRGRSASRCHIATFSPHACAAP